jgi:hypothetical protein
MSPANGSSHTISAANLMDLSKLMKRRRPTTNTCAPKETLIAHAGISLKKLKTRTESSYVSENTDQNTANVRLNRSQPEMLTTERIAELRLAYIKRLEKQVADLKLLVEGRNAESAQLNRYIGLLHSLIQDEGLILTDEFNAKAEEIFNGGFTED